ncbi:DUF2207 domain-containing protein [Amycolatopsis benzoatilytica]|uniref:DUF2207 domain-containing protein n=1 Tax=Amycolatopsis benzoatilytica TaxID=346045 RepID=UPI000382DBED|nr:DUF2207 domain-containing protein [Amycolatopsis benzoatilytica]
MNVAALLAIPFLAASPVAAQDQPSLPGLPQSVEVALKVQQDGSLSVTEAVSVPRDTSMTRTISLRTKADDNHERVRSIRDISIEGAGNAESGNDQVTFYLRGGTSVIRYTVDGTVGTSLGVEHVTWDIASGWDTRIELVRATFAAPAIPDALSCLAGPPGSTTRCGAAQIDHSGLTRVSVSKLNPGSRVELTAELPGGTVSPTERLAPTSPFAASAPVWWTWLAFAVLSIIGALAVFTLRRRDRQPGHAVPVELHDNGRFSSPDGVLPGHLGLLLTGRVASLDLAATVLDLCVRNYLWVSEASPGDWVLIRRNPPDQYLTAFEHAVYAAAVPEESARLSEVGKAGVRELVDDVVRRGWFFRKRQIGPRLSAYGVFLTVLLAFTVGYAQLGLMLLASGVAVTAAGRLLPMRRKTGRDLRDRLLGLNSKLLTMKPPRDELLFSRALPYAYALGEADAWLAKGCSLTAYWCGSPEADALPAARTSGFVAALTVAFECGQHLRPEEPKTPVPA